jgi:hypothetical protein
MMAGGALSPDRRCLDPQPAALIVIRALHCTEPTAPSEALPIGLGTHTAAGVTSADSIEAVKGLASPPMRFADSSNRGDSKCG